MARENMDNRKEILALLDKILEAELSGVVRYLHYSFMIFGPNRIPITKWFRDHAEEGIAHAVIIGEKITALGGHPSIKIKPVPETNQHSVLDILTEGLEFERDTLTQYHALLKEVEGNVALEETLRALVKEETEHIEEVEKMIRTSPAGGRS
jgi:bacterioferritin